MLTRLATAGFKLREIATFRLREHFKTERTSRGDSFEQADFHPVAKPISGACSRADQCVRSLDVIDNNRCRSVDTG